MPILEFNSKISGNFDLWPAFPSKAGQQFFGDGFASEFCAAPFLHPVCQHNDEPLCGGVDPESLSGPAVVEDGFSGQAGGDHVGHFVPSDGMRVFEFGRVEIGEAESEDVRRQEGSVVFEHHAREFRQVSGGGEESGVAEGPGRVMACAGIGDDARIGVDRADGPG